MKRIKKKAKEKKNFSFSNSPFLFIDGCFNTWLIYYMIQMVCSVDINIRKFFSILGNGVCELCYTYSDCVNTIPFFDFAHISHYFATVKSTWITMTYCISIWLDCNVSNFFFFVGINLVRGDFVLKPYY